MRAPPNSCSGRSSTCWCGCACPATRCSASARSPCAGSCSACGCCRAVKPPLPRSPGRSAEMHLVKAPHRLMFFIGAGNVLLAMAWWSAWLVSTRWPDVLHLAQPAQYAGWLHATVMQYQVLASFVFGFLLTVFPRWMGLPDLPRARYLPVGIGVFG